MNKVRVAATTINLTPLAWTSNLDSIIKLVQKAKEQDVQILCLPELTLSGYGCEDAFLSPHTSRIALNQLQTLMEYTEDLALTVGLPVFFEGHIYNGVAMLQNKRVLGINLKKQLPREGVHYEPRWFHPWQPGRVKSITLADRPVPIGDLYYKLGDIHVGIEICEEGWTAIPAAARIAEKVDLVLNSSASHFAIGKFHQRQQLVANSSRALNCHYVYSNIVGLEAGRLIYDGGPMIATSGQINHSGKRFGFADYSFVPADLSIDKVRLNKARNLSDTHPQDTKGPRPECIVGEYLGTPDGSIPVTNQISKDLSDNEEFLLAEILGLFDYMRKSGSHGFVLSLSGGCDSSTVATLTAHMISAARKELGDERFAEKINAKQIHASDKAWTKELLTCIYQATENSGEVTEEAAQKLCEAIGAKFHRIDIEPVHSKYKKFASDILGRDLNWQQDDLVLQNIQARSRSALPWMIANEKGALLVTTSNRSEADLGYATMDGDTSGGLAPLGGIHKHFLRQWLKWAEKDCQLGRGAIEVLSYVNCQAPTAELRPKDQKQKDEDDLMPYEILAAIEDYAIYQLMGPRDILNHLTERFPSYSADDHKSFLLKFKNGWQRSQWKRERLAPSFHVDAINVDPRSWFRFPIFSGEWLQF